MQLSAPEALLSAMSLLAIMGPLASQAVPLFLSSLYNPRSPTLSPRHFQSWNGEGQSGNGWDRTGYLQNREYQPWQNFGMKKREVDLKNRGYKMLEYFGKKKRGVDLQNGVYNSLDHSGMKKRYFNNYGASYFREPAKLQDWSGFSSKDHSEFRPSQHEDWNIFKRGAPNANSKLIRSQSIPKFVSNILQIRAFGNPLSGQLGSPQYYPGFQVLKRDDGIPAFKSLEYPESNDFQDVYTLLSSPPIRRISDILSFGQRLNDPETNELFGSLTESIGDGSAVQKKRWALVTKRGSKNSFWHIPNFEFDDGLAQQRFQVWNYFEKKKKSALSQTKGIPSTLQLIGQDLKESFRRKNESDTDMDRLPIGK